MKDEEGAELRLAGRGAGLDAVKFGVDFVACDQFVVGAFLGDKAAFEHDDLVGVADRAEAVRDGDDGAAFHQAFERFHDDLLRLGVERGGRLVEDEDRVSCARPRGQCRCAGAGRPRA